MKTVQSASAIALVFAFAATTHGWTGAYGQELPASSGPPVVSANRNTRIDVTSSGTPIINISAPRADGTSYNVFSRLNIGKEGVIFNNSIEAGRSQIGGQILANNRLAQNGQAASLILNEVTGGTRSDLQGVLEVFGKRSALVIANPSGITCDGCGFINISRASLSSGKISFGKDGAFTGFAVSGGDVRIEGRGLLAGNVDYFDIVTGLAAINANLFARDIVIAGGNGEFDYASRSARPSGPGNAQVAIDSSLLGGMYANRIRLIGTGDGVGINLKGLVNALEGPLDIRSDGAIVVRNAAAATDVSIRSASSGVTVEGPIYSGANATIEAFRNIDVSGDLLGAAHGVSLKSGADITLAVEGLYAGLSGDGRFGANGSVSLSASGTVKTAHVRTIASEDFSLSATIVQLDAQSLFSARNIIIAAGSGLDTNAVAEATGNLSLSGDSLRLAGSIIANDSLNIRGRTVQALGRLTGLAGLVLEAPQALEAGNGAMLESAGLLALTGGSIDNGGQILGLGAVRVEAGANLQNSGSILSARDLTLDSTGPAVLGGFINANGRTSVRATGEARVTGTLAGATNVALTGAAITIQGLVSSGGALKLDAGDRLTAQSGSTIVADGALALAGQAIVAQGMISSGGMLSLNGRSRLDLSGQTQVAGAIQARATHISLGGLTVANGSANFEATKAIDATGIISARGALSAAAGAINLAKGAQVVSEDEILLSSGGELANAGTVSAQSLRFVAGNALLNQGTVFAAKTLELNAAGDLTQSGTAESGGTLRLEATDALHTSGSITAVGDFSARAGADLVQDAHILLGKSGTLSTTGALIHSGALEAAGPILLSGAHVGGVGSLLSDTSVTIRALAAGIDLGGEIASRASLTFDTSGKLGLLGRTTSDGLLEIHAHELGIGGVVVSGADVRARVVGEISITSAAALESNASIAIESAEIDNKGLIYSAGALAYTAHGAFFNSGAIASRQGLSLSAERDFSNTGSLQAAGDFSAAIGGAAMLGGTASGMGSVALSANSLDLTGTLASGGALDLAAAGAIELSGQGVVSAGRAVTIHTPGHLENAGTVIGNDSLAISVDGALASSGSLQSGGMLSLAGARFDVSGDVTALGTLLARTNGEIRVDGTISAGGPIDLASASLLTTARSRLVSGSDIGVRSSGSIVLGGLIGSGAKLDISGANINVHGLLGSTGTLSFASDGAIALGADSNLVSDVGIAARATQSLFAAGMIFSGGITLLVSGNNLDLSGTLQSIGAVTLTADDLHLGGALASNGELRADATHDIILSGDYNARGRLALNTAGVTRLFAGSRLIGASDVSFTVASFDHAGVIGAAGALDIVSAGDVLAGGTISAGGNATLAARGAVIQNGQVDSGGLLGVRGAEITLAGRAIGFGGITISGSTVLLDSTGDLASGASLLVDSRSALGIFGKLGSRADVSLAAATSLSLGATLSANGAVRIDAGTSLGLSGSIQAGRSVVVVGESLATDGEIVSDANVRFTSRSGGALLDGIISGKTGVSLAVTGDATVRGMIASGSTIDANATGDLSIATKGALLANGAITLRAQNALDNAGLVSSLGGLNLAGARVSSTGTLETGEDVALQGRAITLAGKLVSQKRVTLAATAGALDLGASLQGSSITLSAQGGDLNVRADVNATGLATLSSDRNIALSSRLAANDGIVLATTGGAIDLAAGGSAQSLGNIAIAATDALSNAGQLAAGKDIAVSARRISTGGISANGAITLAANGAGGDIAVTGLVDGNETIALRSTSGAIEVAASAGVRSAEALSIEAQGALTNAGDLAAGTSLDLTSGGLLANSASGVIYSGAGPVRLQGSGLGLGGSVYSGRDLLLRANAIDITGSTIGNGTLSLSAPALAIYNGGLLQSNQSINLALGTAQIDGNIRALSNLDLVAMSLAVGTTGEIEANGRLNAAVGATLANRGAIFATGDATINADNLIHSGLIQSGGTLSVTSSFAEINAAGTLAASNALSLFGDHVTSAGTLVANGGLGVTGTSDLATSGAITSNTGAIALASNGAALVGGSINAATTADLSGASLTFTGALVANGHATLGAAGGNLAVSGNINTGGMLGLFAGGGTLDLSSPATLFATGGIAGSGRAINAAATLLAPGAITLNASASLDLSGRLATNGLTTLSAGSVLGISNGATIDSASVNLASASLSTRGTINATGAVALSARTDVSVEGRISAGGLISVDAPSRIDVTRTGSLVSGGSISFANVGGLAVAGLVSAVDTVTADLAGANMISGRIEVGNDLVLRGGTLSVPGLAYAGRDLGFITSQIGSDLNSLNIGGTVAAGLTIAISLGGGLQVGSSGQISANGSVTSNSAFANVAGSIAAGTALTLNTRGDNGAPPADLLLSGSLQSRGTLTANAARGVVLSGTSRAISDTNISISGPNINAFGSIGAGDTVFFGATGAITQGGLIQSGRRVVLHAGTTLNLESPSRIETQGMAARINLARDAGDAANIDLRAGGYIFNAGTLYSDGAIAFKSNGASILNTGTVSGLNDVVFQADNGGITSRGAVTAGNLALYQGQDFNNSGTFAAVGNLLLSAPRIINDGLIGAAGSLSLRTPGSLANQNGGTIFAGGDLGIEAGGGVTNDLSTILAVGNIGITAPRLLNNSARIESLGGSIAIGAAQLVNQIKTLEIVAGGIAPSFGGLVPNPFVFQTSCLLVEASCGGSGDFGDGGSPGGDDIVTVNSGASRIIAARDITIDAGTTGIVTNSNSSILAGRNISITADTLNNLATLLNRTETRDIVEQRIVHYVEDANISCPPQAIPGTCRHSGIGQERFRFFTSWDEYEDVVVGTETVAVREPLPTVINAGGAVTLNVNALNNNQPELGGQIVTGSGAGALGLSGSMSANALGGRAGYASLMTADAGQIASPTAVAMASGNASAREQAMSARSGGSSIKQSNAIGSGVQAISAVQGAVVGASLTLHDARGVSALTDRSADPARIVAMNGAPTSQPGAGMSVSIGAIVQPGAIQPVVIFGVGGAVPNVLPESTSGGMTAQNAQLAAGSGAVAIPSIQAANGQAGNLLFDFLRSFNLVNAKDGFGIAGGGGLFTFNNNPESKFLFTTNPGFASTADLFDSDFFFNQLNIPRDTFFTRLGDGFFEAQLISKYVQAATGQAQLGQYSGALDQAKHLLQNALDQQSRLQLSVGVALTPQQVAGLTSSLVWYVKSAVEGRDVLVPVVYLAASDQKEIRNGAVISGSNVVANVAGTLNNSGTIAASRIVSLTAGGDIVNSSGARIVGGTVVASAARDLLAKGGSAISGGNITLGAGRDIVLSATTASTSASTRTDLGKGRFTQSSTTGQSVTGATIGATGTLALSAGHDIILTAARINAGGDASLVAARDINVTGVSATSTVDKNWMTGKRTQGASAETTTSFNGTALTAIGALSLKAGNAVAVKGSDIAASGNITLSAVNGVNIASAQETARFALDERVKKKTVVSTETATTNRLSTISAAGDVTLLTPGAIQIKGAEIAAGGTATLGGGSISIAGVIDTATLDSVTRVKKSGLASKKITTTTIANSDQSVVASAVTGDRVSIASTGDISILGSNIVSVNGTSLSAGSDVTIGTLAATDSFDKTVKVKKTGISVSGSGLFAGVAKASNATTLDIVTNSGSVIGAAKGNVAITANGALAITGSTVGTAGDVLLAGQNVTIKNATDTADATSLSKSSSFGLSIRIHENVSGAVKSLSGLPDRVATSSQGTAGAAVSAVSETLRTVSSVTSALRNTVGISASFGFSKSKISGASQETAVVGSTVTGNSVTVRAAQDLQVTGSAIKAADGITLTAGRDAIFQSAQNTLATQAQSKSSGASIGVSVGFGIVGGANASAFANVSGSQSSGQSSETTQVNTNVTAGGTLALTTGRDATLKGAVVAGKTVVAGIGRDLAIQSVQDIAISASSSTGFSAGLTYSPMPGKSGVGANGGVSVGKGSGSSAIVAEQSALLARGGSLAATVTGNTDLEGGVIAALNSAGKDSGKLTLATGTLSASDIQDSAKSRDISIGVSVSVNDPFKKGVKGANTPTIDGHYFSATFEQDTKATIGQGQVVIAVPAANVTINRDLAQSQVVTKDTATGFSLYLDEAAIRETVALLKGDKANSTILQGVDTLTHDPLKPVREVVAEINSLSDSRPNSGALDTLLGKANRLLVGDQRANEGEGRTIANDPRFIGKGADEVGAIRGADAVAEVRLRYGEEAATAYAALLQTPEGKAQLRAVGLITLAYRDKGGNLQAIKDGLIPAELRLEAPSGAVGPGDLAVNGHAPTFGDKTVSVLAGAGKLINKVPPQVQEAASFGTSLLLGGPAAAVGGYFIGKAVEQGIKNSPDAQAAIKEVGLQSVDLLSSSSPGRNRADAEANGYEESQNLLTAAGTLLNIGTLKKLVGKAGGLINGADKAGPVSANPGNPNLTLSSADGGYFLEAPHIKVPYGTGIANQGFAFENALESILGVANRLPPGTKAFDYFNETIGHATSVKTLDTLTDPKLINPDSIYASLKGNLDSIIQYEPRPYSRIDIPNSVINSRELIVGIPKGTTSAQIAAIVRAIDYGRLNGISVKIVTTGAK